MKMGKSAGNTILISDTPEEIIKRLKSAVTDPQKVRRGDPGRPEVCLIFNYHKKFNAAEIPEIEKNCRSGALGCSDCKLNVGKYIIKALEPIREKRSHYESHREEVKAILDDGETKARTIANQTMSEVHEAMKLG